ncbi:prepilin-type N-terminal cleavage/methylation domain-containing protein [Pontibacillus yanchengensis]|uniref:Prepilin-type N-terminal cleavage/methylation domain-containing protein n=1 Tax=Pontibacillus yanchengensis TaxID=462910 RepID=A0ACC7VF00_9BACI|nr:prepilin-type N-terminal cleavage/methylation domain-containing protein [Pontibacillus yanchengensis]MYL53352.1 prepilin-type N-terminal cleavage/methylation domain-containing protein [Pontibacillus yanchengensis]
MLKKLRERFGNEKGFTLVELLAVIVILGIIAAIAVPAIGNIISNTKDDAHEGNAIAMIEASRLAYANGLETTDDKYTLDTLVSEGYMESVPNDPVGDGYDGSASFVEVSYSDDSADTYTATLQEVDSGTTYIDAKTVKNLENSDTTTN